MFSPGLRRAGATPGSSTLAVDARTMISDNLKSTRSARPPAAADFSFPMSAREPMAKHGSKQKSGPRYPCGKLRPAMDGATAEHQAHREHLVGDNERKQRYASYPLGVLYARRLLLSGDHHTGLRYAGLFARAVRPSRLPSILGNLSAPTPNLEMSLSDDHEKREAQDRSDYLAARAVLDGRGIYVARAVDDLVIYEHEPLTTARLDLARDGLDALHRHFEAVDARSRAAQK